MVSSAVFASPAFRSQINGVEIARGLTFGLFALAVYEYAITLDDEKEYFWKGPLTVSRGLFFINRYAPLMIMMICIACFTVPNPDPNACEVMIQATYLLTLIAVCVIEAILLIRLWCLFPGSLWIKVGLIGGFAINVVLSFLFLFLSAYDIQILHIIPDPEVYITGCWASRPDNFWRIYLPSLLLHTAIYALTVYRAMTKAVNDPQSDGSLRKRLLTDSGVFYFAVLFTVGFTSIGSFITSVPEINIPAIFSPIVLAITSVGTTRIMINLRQETVHLDSLPEWFVLSPAVIPSRRSSVYKVPLPKGSYWEA